MSRRKYKRDDFPPLDEETQESAPAAVKVRLRSKWGYDHAIRRMEDGTVYHLHKNIFTEIQARHVQELAAQEPYLFQEN